MEIIKATGIFYLFVLFFCMIMLPVSTEAQYSGGDGDGYDSESSGEICVLNYNAAFYGGSGDGYCSCGSIPSPLPVELISFSAKLETNIVILTWQTATETNNYGFFVERNVIRTLGGADGWQPIDFIPGAGNSNSPKEYRYIDELTDLEKIPETIEYRLKQTDTDGSFEYSDVVAVETQNFASLPTNFQLYQNYPNPFNPSTKIKFSVGQICNLSCPGIPTTLKIYNSLGAEITTLVNELKSPGTYEVEWNAAGFASGIYFCAIKSGNFRSVRKIILMK